MKRFLIPLLLLLLCPLQAHAFRAVNLLKILPVGQPLSATFDQDGHIYIPLQTGGVRVLGPDGELARTLGGTTPDGKPLLGTPRGVTVLGDRIFITDAKFHRIAVFTIDGKFQEFIGQRGDDPKEFDTPIGILSYRGQLYIADSENERIQVLGPDGIYITSFGQKGAGDALLNEPTQLAIDPLGRLLILDDASDVKIFSLTGDYLGKQPTGERRPVALAADGEGVFIADRSTLQIAKLDLKGKEILSFGTKGKERTQFLNIDGMAAAPNGRILIADSKKGEVQLLAAEQPSPPVPLLTLPPSTTVRLQGTVATLPTRHISNTTDNRIYAISTDTNPAILIYAEGKLEKTLRLPGVKPSSLAVAPDGTLWVTDEDQERLVRVDSKGEILGSVGSSGSKDGSFYGPTDVAISPAGLVYVADSGNRRIQIFNREGTFLNSFGGKKEPNLFRKPLKLQLDRQGSLYVLDSDAGTITALDPTGKQLVSFGGLGDGLELFRKPVDFTLSESEVFVLDGETSIVKAFSLKGKFLRQFGSTGSDKVDMKKPAGICTLSDTEILVADAGNSRLQIYGIVYTPDPPPRLTATAGPRKVSLLWEKNAESYVSNYNLYRSTRIDGRYELIASQSANSFFDLKVDPGTTYYYKVAAVAQKGNEGALSKNVEASPTKVVPLPLLEIQTTPQEWSVDFKWTPTDPTNTVGYRIYRIDQGQTLLVDQTAEAGISVGNLDPNTSYAFEIAAVSIDEMESPRIPVTATTLVTTKAPIELEFLDLQDIFTNTYKIYETEGVGTLRISNNTSDKLSKVKITFVVKDFMDFPTEAEIADIAPRSHQDIVLKAVFNNQLLNLTEDTPVQSELTAIYYKNQEQTKFSKNQTIKLFEKHRLSWDDRERFAAFVTPKDPVILEFSRSIASQFSDLSDPILYAGVSFDALGIIGVGYLQDPSNPYQVTSGKTDYVDYIQYPRETMTRKSGDCDDLVGLYSSVLESLGIRTKIVEVPGHMFMIFAVPVRKDALPANFSSMYVEHEDELWIPVEVTQIGSPFMKAWETGVRNYAQWKDNGLTLMDTRAAWGKYKPASLPMTDWRPPTVSADDITRKFKDELSTLRKIRLQNLGQVYLARLKTDPNDVAALLQLGIVYARNQESAEALPALEKARKLAPENAAVHNNLGNAYFQLERYADAEKSYAESIRLDGADPYIWVNRARTLLRLDKNKDAVAAFAKAIEINPAVRDQFKTLAITLDTPF